MILDRLGAAARYVLTGQKPADWFGPLQPVQAFAPQVAGRQFDFRAGINLDLQPRAGEPVGFRELRALADNYDLLRLVIEKRKEQLASLDWEIMPRDKAKTAKGDGRIKQASDFLAYPDREHNWDQWSRMLVEDMLVIDAATIYPRRSRGGGLYALEPIDGSTIKRVLDDYGRTPLPPDPAYQQILKGLPAVDYTAEELLYLPRNLRTNRIYGLPPVEQIIMTVNIGLRRNLHKLQYYTEGTVPDAFAGLPTNWSMAQIAEFQAYFDALLENNTAQRRKVRFLPESIAKAFVQTKAEALKDDYDEWLARIVCYCMQVSNQAFIKQMNRSTSETAQEQAQQEGREPLKIWLKSVADRILDRVFGWPDLELRWKEEEDQDPEIAARVSDMNLRNGKITLNEARAADGLPPIEGGDTHLIYTAQGAARLAEILNPPAPEPVPETDAHSHGGDGYGEDAGGTRPFAKAAAADGRRRHKDYHRIDPEAGVPAGTEDRLRAAWARYLGKQAPRIAAALSKRLAGRLAKADGAEPGADEEAEQAAEAGADAGAAALAQAAAGGASAGNVLGPAETAAAAAMDEAIGIAERQAVEGETAAALGAVAKAGADAGAAALAQAAAGGASAGIVLGPAETVEITALAHPKAEQYAAERAAALVTRIDETTRGALRDMIVRAQAEGWSTDRLSAEIQQAYTFSAKRADLIARTELAASSIRGNVLSWLEGQARYGVATKKRVILGLNENHCPVCLSAWREGAIPLEEDFAAGAAPPFHPNCYCDLVPVVGEKEEPLAKAYNPDQPRDFHGHWAAGAIGSKRAINRFQKHRHAIKRFANEHLPPRHDVTRHEVGPLQNAAAHRAASRDIRGYRVVAENTGLHHALRQHGDAATESKRGQVPINKTDFAHIPEIIQTGEVAPGEKTGRGADALLFQKQIGSHLYRVVAEVRHGTGELAFKTMMKRK